MTAGNALCVCGHPHQAHEHLRKGTDCALCGAGGLPAVPPPALVAPLADRRHAEIRGRRPHECLLVLQANSHYRQALRSRTPSRAGGGPHATARLPDRRRAQGGHHRAARRPGPAPGAVPAAVKEPKFFLSDGRPPATGGPGDVQTYQEHVWRQADYEALFDPAPPGTLRGEATPFYLYDLAAHDRIKSLRPGREADPAAARPGGPGALQLDPPVERRARAGGRLPRPPAAPSRRGSRPAGPTSGTTSASAGTAAQVQHLLPGVPARAGAAAALPRAARTRRPPPWTGSATSSACAPGVLTAIPKENVNRHVVEDNGANRVLRGAAAGRRPVRAPVPGAAAAGRPRPDAHPAAPQDRHRGR